MEITVVVWLLILTVGVAALGFAIAYGMRRNASRTRLEKNATQAATKAEYDIEEQDRR